MRKLILTCALVILALIAAQSLPSASAATTCDTCVTINENCWRSCEAAYYPHDPVSLGDCQIACDRALRRCLRGCAV